MKQVQNLYRTIFVDRIEKSEFVEKIKQLGEHLFMNSFTYALEQRNLEELDAIRKCTEIYNYIDNLVIIKPLF